MMELQIEAQEQMKHHVHRGGGCENGACLISREREKRVGRGRGQGREGTKEGESEGGQWT